MNSTSKIHKNWAVRSAVKKIICVGCGIKVLDKDGRDCVHLDGAYGFLGEDGLARVTCSEFGT